mgnify:CR=1 FL=1|tara:strand:+ start:908 stop:1486 length:579 start_codon:yes stop_codon:yes gene_type:complete
MQEAKNQFRNLYSSLPLETKFYIQRSYLENEDLANLSRAEYDQRLQQLLNERRALNTRLNQILNYRPRGELYNDDIRRTVRSIINDRPTGNPNTRVQDIRERVRDTTEEDIMERFDQINRTTYEVIDVPFGDGNYVNPNYHRDMARARAQRDLDLRALERIDALDEREQELYGDVVPGRYLGPVPSRPARIA